MAQKFTYVPPPTGELFHKARLGSYLYKSIRGVPGSGKSVVCCWDMRYKAEMQPEIEDPRTGQFVRWSRWGLFRKTFPALKDTTIKTWTSWFPVGALTDLHESPPIEGVFEAPSMRNDGTIVRMELKCYATEANNFLDALDSLELSGAWVNEAAQIEWDKIHKIQERCGRFKPPGGAASGQKFLDFGVIMDTNTPLETSWWHEKEMVEIPDRMLWMVQPPAMIRIRDRNGDVQYVRNDEENNARYRKELDFQLGSSAHECPNVIVSHGTAENIEHHNDGWDYYEKQLIGAKEDYIRTRLLNEYGRTKDGLPVYEQTWNDTFHCAKDMPSFSHGIPLMIGMDLGRNPAAVFGQVTSLGQMRVFDELPRFNMSVPYFVQYHLIPFLTEKYGYPNCRMVIFCDPAGTNASEMSDESALQYLNQTVCPTMIPPCLLGKNNDLVVRLNAVEDYLNGARQGEPDFLLSAKCEMLREGFNGGYHFQQMRTASGSTDKFHSKPEKNEFSHCHDALQYLCCGAKGGLGATQFGFGMSGMSGFDASSLKTRARCV